MSYIIPEIILRYSSNIFDEVNFYDYTTQKGNPIETPNTLRGSYIDYTIQLGIDPTIEGIRKYSFFDVIYNQIWLAFRKLDVGLISNDKYFNFYIWNAYFTDINLIEILRQNLDGVYLTSNITGLFKPTQEKQTQIKVTVDGSPVINGDFIFRFDIEDDILHIPGLRVVPMPITQYISDSFVFKISYSLAIAVNMFLKEQRRLLVDKPLRKIDGTVILEQLGASNVINLLDKFGGRLCACSIPFEKLTPVASNLQGLKNIYVNETISQYSEIDSCGLLLIYFKNTGKASCYEIESINKENKLIVLKTPIIESCPRQDIELYPAMFSIIESASETVKIGKYALADISIQEVYN